VRREPGTEPLLQVPEGGDGGPRPPCSPQGTASPCRPNAAWNSPRTPRTVVFHKPSQIASCVEQMHTEVAPLALSRFSSGTRMSWITAEANIKMVLMLRIPGVPFGAHITYGTCEFYSFCINLPRMPSLCKISWNIKITGDNLFYNARQRPWERCEPPH